MLPLSWNASTSGILLFLSCILVHHLANSLRFLIRPKLVVETFSKIKFQGLEIFLKNFEETSLLNFIRLRRYKVFDFTRYCLWPTNKKFFDRIIQEEIPASIANDLINVSLLINEAKTLKYLFERPHIMEKICLTASSISIFQLPLEEQRNIFAHLVKRQFRRIYSKDFYLSLMGWEFQGSPVIVNEENWEFFDALCFRQVPQLTRNLQRLVHLLLPLAKEDDFALFRLCVLQAEIPASVFLGFLGDLRATGMPIQQSIIALGDALAANLQGNDYSDYNFTGQFNQFLSESNCDKIVGIYHHFKKLLKEKGIPSPAFLLELLAATIPINPADKVIKLLEDLLQSYPPEKVSPYHLYYILDYHPEVAPNFRDNVRKRLSEEWRNISNDPTYRYYFPLLAFTKDELLDNWRIGYFATKQPNIDQANEILAHKEIVGAFRVSDNGTFRFFCDEKDYKKDATRSFITAGFISTACGNNYFLDGLTNELLSLIKCALKNKIKACLSRSVIDNHFLSGICINPQSTASHPLTAIIHEFRYAIAKMNFPARILFP